MRFCGRCLWKCQDRTTLSKWLIVVVRGTIPHLSIVNWIYALVRISCTSVSTSNLHSILAIQVTSEVITQVCRKVLIYMTTVALYFFYLFAPLDMLTPREICGSPRS